MGHTDGVISRAGPRRIISTLGGLLIIIAVARWNPAWATSQPLIEQLIDFLLIGIPGLALVYAGQWLPKSGLRQDVYPRVASWCLGGLLVMLLIAGVMLFNPGGSADEPFWAMAVAGGLGALGGLGIGVYNAQALSRAREAEEHRDRFRAERDLRERIVETNPIGITIVNADRSIRTANDRAAEIVGLSREAFLDLEYDPSMLETTDAGGDPLEEGVFHQVLTTGEAVYDTEREFTRPDGQRVALLVSGAPLHNESGDVIGVIFAFADITERKQLENDLKETVNQLRQFAYAASHDLQEPLRMVSSYLQLLENRYEDDLDTAAREFIAFAVDGADRMRQMVNDLLAFTRIEQADTAFKPVDCNTVVEHVLTDLTVQIEETDASVVTEPLPTVEADELQLEQLFQNLISNALKYCGNEPPTVEIGAERRDGYWVFAVTDHGIGIDPDKTDRIFEVFKRLHPDEEYPGTGIGLALCRRIVERHRGDIWVESEPGEGSTFYFTIPAVAPRPESTQRRESYIA